MSGSNVEIDPRAIVPMPDPTLMDGLITRMALEFSRVLPGGCMFVILGIDTTGNNQHTFHPVGFTHAALMATMMDWQHSHADFGDDGDHPIVDRGYIDESCPGAIIDRFNLFSDQAQKVQPGLRLAVLAKTVDGTQAVYSEGINTEQFMCMMQFYMMSELHPGRIFSNSKYK